MSVSREKLYEEVWAEPMTTVAPRYGVSSSFLARICDRLNIPTPARGYWARLAAGKAPEQPALPEPRPGEELEWSRDGEPSRVAAALPKAPDKSSRRRPRPTFPSGQHELLVGARQHFENVKVSEMGYLLPSKKRLVDVFVSKDVLDRALDVANELFVAFEGRDHRVAFAPNDQPYRRPDVDERIKGGSPRYHHRSWSPWCPTVAFVGTVAIGLTIYELSESVEVQYVDGKYIPVSQIPEKKRRAIHPSLSWTSHHDLPAGKLCLRASSPYPGAQWEKEWRESAAGELSAKIPSIIRHVETEAATIAGLVEDAERQWAIERQRLEAQQQQWIREEQVRRREQNLKASLEELFAIIEAWAVAKRIEQFFEDVEKRAPGAEGAESKALLDRIHRARQMLGGTDALSRFRNWKAPEER
jgi:hypothetical protein